MCTSQVCIQPLNQRVRWRSHRALGKGYPAKRGLFPVFEQPVSVHVADHAGGVARGLENANGGGDVRQVGAGLG
jgi:hypothetical protein